MYCRGENALSPVGQQQTFSQCRESGIDSALATWNAPSDRASSANRFAKNHKKTIAITDRKQAIKVACQLANENDIILIAGKGHENYQEINGVRHHFDDMETVKEILSQLNK